MRFIGNKEKLLNNIYEVVLSTDIEQGIFCDFFSGTASVGRFFKQKGYKIISSDVLYSSYVLQEAYIKNNDEPLFKKLLKKIGSTSNALFSKPLDSVIAYLNNLKGQEGFIYKNYTEEGTGEDEFTRKYFSAENGKRIDGIRIQIENWKNEKLLTDSEYYILLASLVESVPFYANISGVYAAFLKHYDPRALKKFQLRNIQIYKNHGDHEVYNLDSTKLVDDLDVDILYIDPPYNNRQYAPNYHLVETIAKYDNPMIKGSTGMRNYEDQKSSFCNPNTALQSLDEIAAKAKYKYLLLSYNSEGIMPKEKILATLGKYGTVDLKEIDYRRFKSNSHGDLKDKKIVQEQIYVLRSA